MYDVNGIALDNLAKDWWLDARTKTLMDLQRDMMGVTVPGIDGVISIPASFNAPVWPVVMRLPRARFEELAALFYAQNSRIAYTVTPERSIGFTVASHTLLEDHYLAGVIHVSFALRLDGAFWRDTTESTSTPTTLASGSQLVAGLFPGLSAVVQDAIVRVRGGVGSNMIVQDSGGSWFSYGPSLTTSQWLRFDSASGQAWVTPSDVWVGGTDVSGDIDYGGPRGVFEVTPTFSDPATRSGQLTVSTLSRSGTPQIWVRGKGAYLG